MFKLFNRRNDPTVIDKIFIHTKNKWPYCNKLLTENPKTIFIGWFDDTIEEMESYFLQTNIQATILKARTIRKSQIEGMQIIFLEHHPMKSKENQLLEQLGIKDAIFLTSADEALLKHFGGDKLIAVMENMGMNENDPIEHALISQSIAAAQKKIESKIFLEQSTRSQAEWIERNMR